MKDIKVALINMGNYCLYPDGITNIKDFINFLNKNYHSFVELEFLSQDGCVAPFFIDEDLKTEKEYWNPLNIRFIKEGTAYFLSKFEYEEKLKKVISEKCIHCINYSEDCCEEDFKSHIEHIDLNGECYGFEMKKQN